MSIIDTDRDNFVQDLSVSIENKELYGEIFTPFSLIDKMLDLLPKEYYSEPSRTWLDSGAGSGYITMCLYWKLMNGLADVIIDTEERSKHIIEKMLFMSEISETNIQKLTQIFGDTANILEGDFHLVVGRFDTIVGNPPYNTGGIKKVPTNSCKNKLQDGKMSWLSFTRHSLSLLRDNGSLLYIIPSLWMRPDRAKSYDLITSFELQKVVCMTNTETNRLFKGEAQTPTSYFHLVKRKAHANRRVCIYDKDVKRFVEFNFIHGDALPVHSQSVIKKVMPYDKSKCLVVKKTNMPPKSVKISPIKTKECQYPNIRTAVLKGLSPELVIDYSNKPMPHYGKKKIVMGHKMYGFPFIDSNGEYGISNRDAYVVEDINVERLKKIASFFKTKSALYLMEGTRYRMKYLEKEAFWMIPKVGNILDGIWSDDVIWEYFSFSEEEIEAVKSLHRKDYTFSY